LTFWQAAGSVGLGRGGEGVPAFFGAGGRASGNHDINSVSQPSPGGTGG